MNFYKIILFSFLCIFIQSCADYQTSQRKEKKERVYYSSSGFALIYADDLYINKVINKKIMNDDLIVMHHLLKRNTPIKIINPKNSKVVETKIYRKANYPKIFNVVISSKVASVLDLDVNNPYIEIIEIKKNKTFIAKEGNIFDEEKNVSEKAPVDEIKMDVLSNQESKSTKKLDKKNDFIIVINDFYFIDSANNLKNELIGKTKINNISIEKINNNKYRLFVGPFKNFNALKIAYISLNNLGFENIKINIK